MILLGCQRLVVRDTDSERIATTRALQMSFSREQDLVDVSMTS